MANIGINDTANLICLCPNCHESFDRNVAGWVFLPCPLDPFLTQERAFQATRLADPSATRSKISWNDIVFQPYIIRTGYLNFDWSTKSPVKWHGDPVLAILRSNAIAAGLPRLPVEIGGVPQHVAEMYLELVSLYGTAIPVMDDESPSTIRVMDPNSIRVILPSNAAEMIKLSAAGKRKREETPDDSSDGGSSVASTQTGRSNDTQHTKQPFKKARKRPLGLMASKQRSRKMMAAMKAMSEMGSLASSDQPGHSSDITPQKIQFTRGEKRAQEAEDAEQEIITRWQDAVVETE